MLKPINKKHEKKLILINDFVGFNSSLETQKFFKNIFNDLKAIQNPKGLLFVDVDYENFYTFDLLVMVLECIYYPVFKLICRCHLHLR